MSYTKQNFVKGQILKADHLNAMENGIEANDLAINQFSEELNTLHTAAENANQAAAGVQGEIAEINNAMSHKISKFYASNLSATHLADSDNGYIHDMRIYGRCVQDGTPTPDAPVEIQSVVNPVVTAQGKNLLNTSVLRQGDYDGSNQSIRVSVDVTNRIFAKSGTQVSLSYTPTDKVNLIWIIITDKYNNVLSYSVVSNPVSATAMIDRDGYITPIFGGTSQDGSWSQISVDDVIQTKPQIEIGAITAYEPYKAPQSVKLPYTLHAIPVSSGGNYTDASGQQWVADYVDVERGKLVKHVGEVETGNTIMQLTTPTETDLTPDEIAALKGLQTYYPTTNIAVTSDQVDGNITFDYPVSMAEGWNYVKQQIGDQRNYIYDLALQTAEAYVNSEYAVTLTELGV